MAASAHPLEIEAHRGSSCDCPENTMAAFRRAVELGAPSIELDIHETRDGELVVMHDITVDRTTDGKGSIADLTVSALRRLDCGRWKGEEFAGERIPLLEEVLLNPFLSAEAKKTVLEIITAYDQAHGSQEAAILSGAASTLGLRPPLKTKFALDTVYQRALPAPLNYRLQETVPGRHRPLLFQSLQGILALDAESGNGLWQIDTPTKPADILCAGGRCFLLWPHVIAVTEIGPLGGEPRFIAPVPRTGKWLVDFENRTQEVFFRALEADATSLYVITNRQEVRQYDLKTLEMTWVSAQSTALFPKFFLQEEDLLVLSETSADLKKPSLSATWLRKKDGQALATISFSNRPALCDPPMALEPGLVAVLTGDRELALLDRTQRKLHKRVTLSNETSHKLLGPENDHFLLARIGGGQRFVSINGEGEEKGRIDLPQIRETPFFFPGGFVIQEVPPMGTSSLVGYRLETLQEQYRLPLTSIPIGKLQINETPSLLTLEDTTTGALQFLDKQQGRLLAGMSPFQGTRRTPYPANRVVGRDAILCYEPFRLRVLGYDKGLEISPQEAALNMAAANHFLETHQDNSPEIRPAFGQLENNRSLLGPEHQPVPRYHATRVRTPVRVDGGLNDGYDPALTATLDRPVQLSRLDLRPADQTLWRGPNDLSAKAHFAYDEKNLYIAIEVHDNFEIGFDGEADRWIGDMALIGIDPANSRNTSFNPGQQMLLSLARMIKPQKPQSNEERPQGELEIHKREDGSGQIYEISLPWTYIDHGMRAPTPGRVLGINILVIDDDGEGREPDSTGKPRGSRKAIALTPGLFFSRFKARSFREGPIPAFWGELILDE